jgi:hypothetical protein
MMFPKDFGRKCGSCWRRADMVLRLLGTYVFILRRKEVEKMAVIYVALIIKGKRTYASVPAVIKEQVRELLIDLELEDLIIE